MAEPPPEPCLLPWRRRLTARVLLREERGDVLLLRFKTVRHDERGQPVAWQFWAAPGGEIEPGETPVAAAHRELAEELGLAVELCRPVLEEETTFEHQGYRMRNRDHFFTAVCPRASPVLAGVDACERSALRELRWWNAAELLTTQEMVYPVWLAAWMGGGVLPASVMRVTPPAC